MATLAGQRARVVLVIVVDPARTGRQVSPNVPLNLAAGLAAGLVLAVCAAVGMHLVDRRITTREKLAGTGLPVLAAVPRIGRKGFARRGWRDRLRLGRARPGPETWTDPPQYLSLAQQPYTPFSESIRVLRTNLVFLRTFGVPKVILVTSAVEGDGKTTIATNLALAFSTMGARTLLVDADLRRQTLSRRLIPEGGPGILHCLLRGFALGDGVRRHPDLGEHYLSILPCGVAAPYPEHILASEQLSALLAQAREEYEFVVFDTPPIGRTLDAKILASYADVCVFVARDRRTPWPAVEVGIERLQGDDHARGATAGISGNEDGVGGDAARLRSPNVVFVLNDAVEGG